MFVVTFLLLAIAVITGILGYGSPDSAISAFMRIVSPAFGALFIIALTLSLVSQVGSRRTS